MDALHHSSRILKFNGRPTATRKSVAEQIDDRRLRWILNSAKNIEKSGHQPGREDVANGKISLYAWSASREGQLPLHISDDAVFKGFDVDLENTGSYRGIKGRNCATHSTPDM
jgi:hypothetical protein